MTGAASGIGQATSLSLAACGVDLVLADIDEDGLADLATRLRKSGCRAHSIPIDVTRAADVERMATAAVAELGGADILVNSAGTAVRGPLLDLEVADIEHVLRVNLVGLLYSCRAIGRLMVAQQSGTIVNVSSIMDTIAAPNRAPYIASKGGVSQLTRALAVEWAPYRVRVNAVSPGYCRTPLTAPALRDPLVAQRIEARIPMKRLAEPEEIAAAILFLASEAASYITGAVLYVDGGYTAG
ncbi:MAG: SDR family oxidoreductase [Candidatus Rokubacteria bacterium]|nr:SDR family oxidoreductase [Candidatus Rokubacteria bacterium]